MHDYGWDVAVRNRNSFADYRLTSMIKSKVYPYLSDQDHKVLRGFCPHCGGSVYSTNDKMKDIVIVYAGTLDNPQQYNQKFDIYTRRAPAWSPMLTTTTQFETWPEFKGDR